MNLQQVLLDFYRALMPEAQVSLVVSIKYDRYNLCVVNKSLDTSMQVLACAEGKTPDDAAYNMLISVVMKAVESMTLVNPDRTTFRMKDRLYQGGEYRRLIEEYVKYVGKFDPDTWSRGNPLIDYYVDLVRDGNLLEQTDESMTHVICELAREEAMECGAQFLDWAHGVQVARNQ